MTDPSPSNSAAAFRAEIGPAHPLKIPSQAYLIEGEEGGHQSPTPQSPVGQVSLSRHPVDEQGTDCRDQSSDSPIPRSQQHGPAPDEPATPQQPALDLAVPDDRYNAVKPVPAKNPERRRIARAKSISEDQLTHLFTVIDAHSNTPAGDTAMVLLMVRAGALPTDLEGLNVQSLFNENGDPYDYVTFTPSRASRFHARQVAMHWQLRDALVRMRKECPAAVKVAYRIAPDGSLFYRSSQGIILWLRRLFAMAGLDGCTSSSGHITFVEALRRLGAPELDIQHAIGHKSLPTGGGNPTRNSAIAEIIRELD